MERIIVVGPTGSGKSTLAKNISKTIEYPYIQLDELFWKPNWTESEDSEFFEKVESATAQQNWVLDGNYLRSNSITWPKADTVVWINLPLWLTLYQNISRSIKRAVTKKELWKNTGNRESLKSLFSKDSIVLWLLKTYSANKERYDDRLSNPQYNHINFIKLTSRKEINLFLKTLLEHHRGD